MRLSGNSTPVCVHPVPVKRKPAPYSLTVTLRHSFSFTNNYYDHFSHSIMHHLPIFSGNAFHSPTPRHASLTHHSHSGPTTRAGPLYVTLSNDYTNFRSTLKRMRGPEHVVRRDKFLSETRARKLVLEEVNLSCSTSLLH